MSDIVENLPLPTSRHRLFSLQGRLGRVRYIAYCMLGIVFVFLSCLISWAVLTLLFFRSSAVVLYSVFALLSCIFLVVFIAMQTVRRAHDFNTGGWLALLLLVPIVNPLLFWFFPGTRGDNAYGPPTEDESPFLKLLAVVLPALLIAGFLSAGRRPPEQSALHPDAPHHTTSLQPYTP